MEKQNIIIISLDEVRPDHLSCYGYKKISTPAIDKVAKEGVRFETCISSSDLTPVVMGAVVTGKRPDKHGARDPFCHLNGPSIATILKEYGYFTAGFTGNGLLTERNGFAVGFDVWKEATEGTKWLDFDYPKGYDTERIIGGYYWVGDFFRWFENNHEQPFFIWGHLLETHEGSEDWLLENGLIKEGELSEFCYYDAKIKMADEKLVAPLWEALDRYGLNDNTILVVMSDHGTDLGQHPAVTIPWRKYSKTYPQHTTMYDCDLRVAMTIRGKGLPKGKVVRGMVGSIDLTPTLLDLIGIPTEGYNFDGSSLLPIIKKGESKEKEIYAEDLFEGRGKGALQAIRSDSTKFMRNLTLATEEYYDLVKDPDEQNNIIGEINKEELIGLRKKLNSLLETKVSKEKEFSPEEKEEISKRLRGLGYIK